MPNHLMNRLHFSGEQSRIDELLKSIKGEETIFDFNNYLGESMTLDEFANPAPIMEQTM